MTAAIPAQQVEIRDRARRNFRFFCGSMMRVKPKKDIAEHTPEKQSGEVGPLTAFVWNEAQDIVWMIMCQMMRRGMPIKLIICKARQLGLSTFFCAWMFWHMWRATYVKTAICAHKKPTLDELNETMNTFYQSFPEGYRPRLRDQRRSARISKEGVYWDDRNCDLKLIIATADALRGVSRDIVLCTEVSSYNDPDEFFGGFLPCMSENSWSTMIMESSPKDGFFWDSYKGARDEGLDGRRAIFLPWYIVPRLYSLPLIETRAGWFRDPRDKSRVDFTTEEKDKRLELCSRAEKYAKALGLPQLAREITWEQMYWRQRRIEAYDGDEEFFNQEYPEDDISCFMRSTRSAFKIALPMAWDTSNPEAVEKECPDFILGELDSTTYMDVSAVTQTVYFIPEAKEGWIDQQRRAGLCIYHDRIDGYIYTIGADIADETEAAGDEDDDSAYSVYCVYCCNTQEQVAEWRGHIDPYDFADELAKAGYYFNQAIINSELNNMGITTYDRLSRTIMYPNRFRWPKFDESGTYTKKEMWVTDERTKQIMMGNLRHAIRSGMFKVRSPGLYEELAGYTIKNGRYKVGRGTYSDRIVAAALAWQAVEQSDFIPYKQIVLGSMGNVEVRREAAGASRRVLHYGAGKKGPIMPPPQTVPAELVEGDTQQVEDIWEAAGFGGGLQFPV